VGELLALARPITRGFYAVSFPVDAAYWLELKGREHADWTIRLQHGEDEETTLTFQPATGTLTFDRSISGNVDFHPDFARVHTASYEPNEHGDITVQILLDASSIEVFINGGKTVLTNQIFPSKYKHTFVRDGISVEKLTLATLEKQR
jgi:sucrose-6-phosphate hydrolase SacC (GH32 family)